MFVAGDDPDVVVKKLPRPVAGGVQRFHELVDGAPLVDALLRATQAEVVWPAVPLLDRGLLAGYLMPRIPSDYLVTIRGRTYPSDLARAIPVTQGPFAPAEQTNGRQRIQLAIAVAQFIDAMHQADLVYNDISWSNIQFRLTPVPGIIVLDFDSTRPLGGSTLVGSTLAPHTLDWADDFAPNVSSAEPGGGEGGPSPTAFDHDRYQLALLMFRLIVTCQLSSGLDELESLPGAQDPAGRRIHDLLTRARLYGGRPTAAEWIQVLGDALDQELRASTPRVA